MEKFVDSIFNEYIESPISSFFNTLGICYFITLVIYNLIKKIYFKYIEMKKSKKQEIIYPDVPEIEIIEENMEINPLTREELANQKQDVLRMREIKKLEKKKKHEENEEKKFQMKKLEIIKKIGKANVNNQSKIKIEKSLMCRRMKNEFKNYDVKRAYKKNNCFKMVKDTFYWVDFGMDAIGDVIKKL